ncbi:MAG: hypothetical protein IPL78_17250 [Chloroflexi bacterium]|nr:hypothetical protein [Chloroflexota bacterium]
MNDQLQATTDHETIKKWVEERSGRPAIVSRAEDANPLGILRINFPTDTGTQARNEITWDEFFAIFEAKKLAFLRPLEMLAAEATRFYKFVNRG